MVQTSKWDINICLKESKHCQKIVPVHFCIFMFLTDLLKCLSSIEIAAIFWQCLLSLRHIFISHFEVCVHVKFQYSGQEKKI